VFDALNSVSQMTPAIKAAASVGGLVEGTLCYSGDLSNPDENLYTLDYYLRIAEQLVAAGAHVLCVKDMAGLLRAPAAHTLVTSLRERFDTPVHLHTHDTGGGQLATYLAASEAGVDAVDGAAAPLSGMTSQPALSAVVAAFAHSERDTGLSLAELGATEPYWEAVRTLYAPFEAGLSSPTGTVYNHEIPGGQLSNLRQQAIAVGLGDRFEDIEKLYADCDRLLGRIIKVTPTSKVVGDLALYLSAAGMTVEELEANPRSADLPDSVIGFLHGELGTPEGGFPEPFRTAALVGRREVASHVDLDAESEAALKGPERRATLNRLLFPKPYADLLRHQDKYGDLFRLPTKLFWYGMTSGGDVESVGLGRGVQILVGLDAIGDPDDRGMRRAVFSLNGQLRPLDIKDSSVDGGAGAAEQADPANPGQVGAPFTGVVSMQVEVGDAVIANQAIAVIEAMKMESVISAPASGVIERLGGAPVRSVEAGDLLAVIATG
jgi:pyruvate carboxylase